MSKCRTIALSLACAILTNAAIVHTFTFGTTIMEPSLGVESGPGDELPKMFYLSPEKREEKNGGSACLMMFKDGIVRFFIYPYKLGSLNALDENIATKLFGTPEIVDGPTRKLTYHLEGFIGEKPVPFTLDVEFSSKGILNRYCLKGFKLTPRWTDV